MSARAVVGMLVGFMLTALPASAQTLDVRAEAGASARVFPRAPLFNDQTSARVSPSLTLAPEIELTSEGRAWRVVGEGFLRLDANDDHRSHADIRELGVRWLGDGVSAFVGAGQVFWGVTEIRHLVDVVNQVDAVEDLDGEDKLGQPMVALTLESDLATVDLYYLPWFRPRTFPSRDARLRGPLPLDDEVVYASSQGRWHPGFAARAFRTLGPLDVGVSAFRGTSREPWYNLTSREAGGPVLQAMYDLIYQVGLDAQWTGESTLLKLEAATVGGHADRIWALTAGVEHTLYGLRDGSTDLGLLAEVMLDSRNTDAPPTVFENDLFLGGRWALNDAAGTSLLGGPLVDWRTGEVLLLVEAERRMGSTWSLELRTRWFANTDPGSLAYGLRNDGFFSLSLTRYF